MKAILLIAALLAVTFSTVVPRVTPIHTHVPLTYQVSLDDTPEQRWKQPLTDYAAPLKKFMDYFDMLPISKAFLEEIGHLAKTVYKQHEFVAEVEAISKISGF